MRKGFLYLVSIMDCFTRKVLDWRISNTLEAEFCLDALNDAIHKFGPPELMIDDQGPQFTSFHWTDGLTRAKTKVSMDGKARYRDNIFIERLWRSLNASTCTPGKPAHKSRPAWTLDFHLQPPAATRRQWRSTARRVGRQQH